MTTNTGHASRNTMPVGAQGPSRRTKCHHLYVSTYNRLVFAAYQGESAIPIDQLQGIPRGLHQLLPLEGITVNLLFYKVFLKHIGCTPSLCESFRSISISDFPSFELPGRLVTLRAAPTFVAASSLRVITRVSACGRSEATLSSSVPCRCFDALWRGAAAKLAGVATLDRVGATLTRGTPSG